MRSVSIHAPVWGRPRLSAVRTRQQRFQSTPPCGGDKLLGIGLSQVIAFQSTPPCGGDVGNLRRTHVDPVSIHAPVWGRRSPSRHVRPSNSFQSTPPCGGDAAVADGLFVDQGFQSTPPCGGDPDEPWTATGQAVSIHAPVWGRPVVEVSGGIGIAVSIHAPVWGRPSRSTRLPSSGTFQSTPPCGGDSPPESCLMAPSLFQSTPPCGGDIALKDDNFEDIVSIHAPVWGRLWPDVIVAHGGKVSIHAPVWGRLWALGPNCGNASEPSYREPKPVRSGFMPCQAGRC